MKISKTMWWVVGGAGTIGLGIGLYVLFFGKNNKKDHVFMGVGTLDKPVIVAQGGGTATAVTEPNWKNPFDMNYNKDVNTWLGGKKIKELPESVAKHFAAKLFNAKGTFNDDEQAVAQVFKSLKDKTQVASLSGAFYYQYGRRDMWQYLRSFLSDSELKELVYDQVRSLPNYRLVA